MWHDGVQLLVLASHEARHTSALPLMCLVKSTMVLLPLTTQLWQFSQYSF